MTSEIIVREEEELTDKILEDDLKLIDLVLDIHNIIEDSEIKELVETLKETYSFRVIYIHKYTSAKELTIGVKKLS